jgi:hypothetical protein
MENLPDHITGDEILELMMQKDRGLFNSSLDNINNNEEE